MNSSKNVLITGSSQGIGKSIAKILAINNYNVFITGRDEKKLEKVAVGIGTKGYFAIDLEQKETEEALYQKCLDSFGKIDILINNAGNYIYNPIEKTANKDIQNMLRLNIEVPYLLTKLVVPHMKENKWGRIINIGSISGTVGEANASLYSTTKASLVGLSKSLALELAEYNITANCINPGWVDTDLVNEENLNDNFSKKELIEMIPQRRFVHPNEVANLCLYLTSKEAKGLTGQSINLCAGLSLG